MFEHVFVTVGTTSFQKLIELMLSDKAIDLLKKWKVKEVRIQGGTSVENERTKWEEHGISFETFQYKESIIEDMQWADLIICHAGAGTTIEALDLGKIVITVPNETLMDNHQMELANKLAQENYAFMSTIDDFFENVVDLNVETIKPFPPARPELFSKYLDQVMERFD